MESCERRRIHPFPRLAPIIPLLFLLGAAARPASSEDQPRVWQPLEIHFDGPEATESDVDPNPFLDFRVQVHFTAPGGHTYNVPGFFNGDGQSGDMGHVWTVRFTPDRPGQWTYRAEFKKGRHAAVRGRRSSSEAAFGKSVAFDGEAGTFVVQERNPNAPGFWKWGRLQYVGGHYLKFADGPYYIKGGCDSPENLLAYADFDETIASHRYRPHVRDWQASDPTWSDSRGKGLIGSLNYLASRHVNSIYFLVQNIGGDGKDVWPFAGTIDPNGNPANDNLHYDISKLHQWNVVFEHAQRQGIMLHFVLNEAEEMNKRELDDAALGVERRLFYREMIARFGHHNALQWNLSEEYDLAFNLGPDRVKEFAQYIRDVDPYDHPITVHNQGRDPDPGWLPFLGDPRFSTTSLQTYQNTAKWGERVEKWRRLSQIAGRPLPINMDEFLEANLGNIEKIRKEVIWATYLSGGQLEVIMESKLETEDFRSLDDLWKWVGHARLFVEENLPFWEMEPNDLSVIGAGDEHGGPQCFTRYGQVYAIYYPVAERTGSLTMWRAQGQYEQRWFNPRTGAFVGSPTRFAAQGMHKIGPPPSDPQQDWAVLIRRLPITSNADR
ncbi:MAG: DUF5060 domain-containing protein [Planctomycetota bacterium]|jgi:hypothetical protein